MAHDAEAAPDSSWQQRAVDRSLGTARARAVSRSEQILAAARELMVASGGLDFTVQDIVDRSGLSLRSFYKHFGGKDELLMALLEELLREFAEDLRAEVDAEADPVDRLKAYVRGFYQRASVASDHGGRAIGTYHVRMLELRRSEFTQAIGPQIALLQEIVAEGIATGQFRRDLGAAETTGLLTITLMSMAQMRVLDVDLVGAPLSEQQLWAWCALAVGIDPSQIDPPSRLRSPRGAAPGTKPTRATKSKAKPATKAGATVRTNGSKASATSPAGKASSPTRAARS